MIRPLHRVVRQLFFSCCLLPLIMRCDHSSLSSGAVIDPSLLRVNLTISQSTDYDGRVSETLEAFIHDENGQTVANSQIQVKVNGNVLSLNNGSSNYYGAYPYYQLANSMVAVGADTTCTVTIVLTDGAEYTLGAIQTQPALTSLHFSPPTTHSRQLPLTLTWQDLEPHNWLASHWKRWLGESLVTELKISKSNRTFDQWENVHYEGGSADEADYVSTTIGSGSGVYTVPLSYFKGPMKQFNTLDILINSEKSLDVDGPFLKGSTISNNRRGLYRVAVTN
jgi:hypothetical protein